MIKVIYAESKNKKDKFPVCSKYTSSINDKLSYRDEIFKSYRTEY